MPAKAQRSAQCPAQRRMQTCAKVGLFYSTMTGNTENVAAEIQTALSGKVGDAVEIADCGAEGLAEYDGFGVGDSAGYGDYFCDAIEEVHRTFASAGCKMVG